MREELAKLYGARRRFQGTVDRFGVKAGWKYPLTTVMLKNVSDCMTKKIVTDHLWFVLHKRFASLDLGIGDVVSFDARVTKYLKGYLGRRHDEDEDAWAERMPQEDYRLSFPTKLAVMERAPHIEVKEIAAESPIGVLKECSQQENLTKWC